MSNKSNKNSKPSEPENAGFKQYDLGAVEIAEIYYEKRPYTEIRFQIPMKVRTFLTEAGLKRYEEISLDSIQQNISMIFRMVEHLGEIGYADEIDGMKLGEFISVLGEYGKGLTDALEIVSSSFARYQENSSSESSEKIDLTTENNKPDDSSLSAVAKAISVLVNNPHTSVDLHNALADYVSALQDAFSEDWKSVEVIENLLEKEAAKEASNEI